MRFRCLEGNAYQTVNLNQSCQVWDHKYRILRKEGFQLFFTLSQSLKKKISIVLQLDFIKLQLFTKPLPLCKKFMSVEGKKYWEVWYMALEKEHLYQW